MKIPDDLIISTTPNEIAAEHLNVMFQCAMCPNQYRIVVPSEGWTEFTTVPRRERRNIQEIFPSLSAGMRELLISGTCPECWNNIFGDEE